MATLDGANTTAQWYQDNYPGGTFSRLDKFVLHTTETTSWPGYSGGASSPNATYHPRLRQVRQHHSNNRSARALRDPSGTAVRENRDNVFQLEIICYSDKRLGDSVGGLWVGDLTDTHMRDIAAMMNQLNDELGLPLQSSVTWREGASSYYGGVRLSGTQFDAYRGILGHVHVSGNTHWDPGGFRYSKLKPHLGDTKEWWEMASLPSDIRNQIQAEAKQGVRDAFVEAERGSSKLGRQVRNALRGILANNGWLAGKLWRTDGIVETPDSKKGDRDYWMAATHMRMQTEGIRNNIPTKLNKQDAKLDALLAAAGGADTNQILARIDEVTAAAQAERDAIADRLDTAEAERDALLGQVASLNELMAGHADGSLDAAEVVDGFRQLLHEATAPDGEEA